MLLRNSYPADVGWLAVEEIGHEHLVWAFLVTMGQDIGALQCLWEEAKDIVLSRSGQSHEISSRLQSKHTTTRMACLASLGPVAYVFMPSMVIH